MRAFFAHLRTELRDQRAGLIAVLVALAVLTPLAFWAFGERLVDAVAERVAAVFVAIALVLYLFAVVGDLYAGESRRDTIAFLRRTPRGLGLAFGAKTGLMVLGFAAVVVWECLILALSWNLWGRSLPVEIGSLLESGFLSPLTLLAAVLAAWVILASTWLRHGGIAMLLAPILAVAVVVPGFVWARANREMASYVVPDPSDHFYAFALSFGAVALAAAAWSWLGGRRFVRSAWSAVWRGLVVVLVVAAGSYAWGAVRLTRVHDLRPDDPDLHFHRALISPDGERLYVCVTRRAPNGKHLTPTRTWSIDLGDGTRTTVGRWGEVIDVPTLGGMHHACGMDSSLEPQPRLILRRRSEDEDRWLIVWVDADTSEVLKVVPSDVFPEDVTAWYDEAGRRASWVRDAEGRTVWLRPRDWALRREEDGNVSTTALVGPGSWYRPIPGGFTGWSGKAGQTRVLDVDTGEVRTEDVSLGALKVSPRTHLRFARGPGTEVSRLWIVDAVTGERQPANEAPHRVVAVLSRTCVLGQKKGKPGRLVLWNPVSGSSEPLPWPADPDAHVTLVRLHGRAGNGDAALVMWHDEVWAVARLDPHTRELRALADGLKAQPWVIALTADGAAVAIEGEKRVVRYGPEEGRREVLFPRPR